MKKIPEVAMQRIGTGACPIGKTMGIEVQDEHGGAVRLFTEAANVPSLPVRVAELEDATRLTIACREARQMI